jgi:CheY-like chemotaxis protein
MKEKGKVAKESVFEHVVQPIPKRILLADDNKTIRDMVSSFLKFLGYEVTLACNGIEALAAFLEHSFDLVLTDLEMPFMDGLRLAGHIKEKSSDTPVILLTGADSGTVLEKMEKGPVDSVIFKPFRMKDLQRTIQGALAPGE